MHYDDAARRFNFLAGLGLGTVLGVGLAMLVAPQKKVRGRGLSNLLRASRAGSPVRELARRRAGGRGWFGSS